MVEFPKGTNQGTHVHENPCSFPCFENVCPPMVTTLNLPRFTVDLLVWLFSTLVVSNASNSSQVINLCQGNQTNVVPLHSSHLKSYPLPSSSSSESTTTSSQEPTKKKRKS
jgi:hypothetical protein